MNKAIVNPIVVNNSGVSFKRGSAPCTIVILGASGDLTRRKLIPALFQLFSEQQLPKCFRIIGFARSEKTNEEFRNQLCLSVKEFSRLEKIDDSSWKAFADRIFYCRGNYDNVDDYKNLNELIRKKANECNDPDNRLIYMATPPTLQTTILKKLSEGNIVYSSGSDEWSRVIIEKPFGRDLKSAKELNLFISKILREEQIYRIDHYLGKETVQNILVFRFANAIFEPIWNRNHIDHIEITAAESIGIEGRGHFYDEAGVIRDFVQNHLLALMSLIAMEQPVSFQANPIRDEKVKVVQSLRKLADYNVNENVVLGQYDGYKNVDGVAENSITPTYAAMRVFIDNWRWQGVPFYLRTGKALPSRVTEVKIHFKKIPFCLFGEDDVCQQLKANILTIKIQPEEGISLRFGCKSPGDNMQVSDVVMDFDYSTAFSQNSPDAYERLLVDAMKGDQTLFSRNDEVERAWEFIEPVLKANEGESLIPTNYAIGSEGPKEANGLTRKDGRMWDAIL